MAAVSKKGRAPRKLDKREVEGLLVGGDPARVMHLDVVGTAEAALNILHVERARIGKWRRNDILLSNGERVQFPEPIRMATTAAKQNKCECGALYEYVEPRPGRKPQTCPECGKAEKSATVVPDHTKLAASPLWWADDIRALRRLLDRHKPRD